MTTQKIALITGVSRQMGLGFETAKQLGALGYQVIITARDIEKVLALANIIQATGMALDVTSDQSIEQLANTVTTRFGKLDVLINNAGSFFDQGQRPLDTDMQFAKDAFDTNLLGAWRMIKAFEPLLKKSDCGRIVNVSSGAGSFSDPVFGLGKHFSIVPVYSLTKLALNGLTVNVARQFANTNIKINAVDPGFIATYPGTEQWGARPVSEGAKAVIWAATLPDDGPSGGFFRDGQQLEW